MDIRTFSLDPNLTVAEIGTGTESAWHFLPFEHCRAQLHALDDRYVLAIGDLGERGTSLAIFDTVERRRTNTETNDKLVAHTREANASSWCYAPYHRSIFIIESKRKGYPEPSNPLQYMRQLSVDGSVNRRFQIAPDFSSLIIMARDDGRIVCVSTSQVAVLDPVSGDTRVSTTDLIHPRTNLNSSLRWFSPDGRWGLRTHPAAIVRAAKPGLASRSGSFLSQMFSRAEGVPSMEDDHPDLVGNSDRRFGRALELFRLDPLGFDRRVIIRYDKVNDETFATLERLCNQRDQEVWNARDEWLASLSQYAPEKGVAWWLYDWIERVRWDDDGQGFTVAWTHGTREVTPVYGGLGTERVTDLAQRHLALDGDVGPISVIPGAPKPIPLLPSNTAVNSIKALVRERSRQIVECGGWTGADVAAALREMPRRIEEAGLDRLVFGSQLQFQFRVEGRTIGEKKFFDTIRKMAVDDTTTILPELRNLLRSYGSAARSFQAIHFNPIASGPSDDSPAALSEAALTLAMLDDTGFNALRDWVITVDQEHDYFAAGKVFPAMALRTGFATADAVRFGVWFFLQQWQTVKYQKAWLGLFKAAPAAIAPAAFAATVLAEAQDVDSFSSATDFESGVSNVQEMLGRTPWDRAASVELDRLLATLGDPSPIDRSSE